MKQLIKQIKICTDTPEPMEWVRCINDNGETNYLVCFTIKYVYFFRSTE